MALCSAQILPEPREHVRPRPADSATMKPALLREPANKHHAQQQPSRPAGKPRNIAAGVKYPQCCEISMIHAPTFRPGRARRGFRR
jgi:hypothetical protein